MSGSPNFVDRDDRINASQAVKDKQKGLAMAFAFYSPKNKKKMTLLGIPAYCHTLLCEGNPDIVRFEPNRLIENRSRLLRQAADIFFRDGRVDTWVFAWEQPTDHTISFRDWHDSFVWRTAEGLENKRILISNWIRLRAFMAAARGLSTMQERRIMQAQLDRQSATTWGDLVFAAGADYGLMLCEVASSLAMGRVVCDLEGQRLRLTTVIRRST
ncbi:hypothetical protein N0A02_25970 [Paraburkholderia acidicola]|uniref:Uncharacterized protein n=1 Tax=Paraburkholderia acidicola TaxID=1912599 RepID=A0ABV1LUA3_9BURK